MTPENQNSIIMKIFFELCAYTHKPWKLVFSSLTDATLSYHTVNLRIVFLENGNLCFESGSSYEGDVLEYPMVEGMEVFWETPEKIAIDIAEFFISSTIKFNLEKKESVVWI